MYKLVWVADNKAVRRVACMLNVVFDADAVYYPGHVFSLQQCGAEPGDEAATTTTPTTVMSVLHCGEGALVVAAIP